MTLATEDLYLFVKIEILNPLLCRFDTVLPIEGSVGGISFQRLSQMYVKISETSVIEMFSIFEISQEIISSFLTRDLFPLLYSSSQITIVSASTESKSIASVRLEPKSGIVFGIREKDVIYYLHSWQYQTTESEI
jgi:hypothetical protein